MGNACDFDSKEIVRAFDEYDNKKVEAMIKLKKHQLGKSQAFADLPILKDELASLDTEQTGKQCVDQIQQEKHEDQGFHRRSVIPPSQRSIEMFKRLQQQSQVPSDFFENVDLSLYFKTLTTMKENCDPNLLMSERRNANKLTPSSSRRSMNSLSDYVRAKESGIGGRMATVRKSGKLKLSSEGQIQQFQSLKN